MTDGEPEPFRMSTDPDAEPDAEPDAAPDAGADAGAVPHGGIAGGESIADLINEAARTAEAQAAAEADIDPAAQAEELSASIWGDAGGGGRSGAADTSALWDTDRATESARVWADDDEVWTEAAVPPEDLTTGPDPVVEEPAVEEPVIHVTDDEEEEEPEPFSFAAGPATTAPAPQPEHEVAADEPETFTFALDGTVGHGGDAPAAVAPQDPAATTSAQPGSWTVPGAGAADDVGDAHGDDDDDEVWIFYVPETDTPLADTDAPLAEAARPRSDTGWNDRAAAQEPRWSVPDLPLRGAGGDDDEPEGFVAAIGGDRTPAPEAFDAGESEPAMTGPTVAEPPVKTATAADEAPGLDSLDMFDDLDDQLDDLDQLDQLDQLDDQLEELEELATASPEDPEEDAATTDGPLDAATAARQVMQPGAVTFSSGGVKKRRRRG